MSHWAWASVRQQVFPELTQYFPLMDLLFPCFCILTHPVPAQAVSWGPQAPLSLCRVRSPCPCVLGCGFYPLMFGSPLSGSAPHQPALSCLGTVPASVLHRMAFLLRLSPAASCSPDLPVPARALSEPFGEDGRQSILLCPGNVLLGPLMVCRALLRQFC